MGRSRRSSSTGSMSDAITQAKTTTPLPSEKALKATRQIFDILIDLRNDNGKSFLHKVESNHDMGIAQSLLQRASQVDMFGGNDASMSVLERLLLAKDLESGYSALHWAMMDRNLAVVLQILRHVAGTTGDSEACRLAHRPMHLLQGDIKNETILSIVNSRDNEGLNPLELLCRLQQSELAKCRRSLATNNVLPAGYADSQRRVLVDPDEPLDNEFHVLQESPVSNTNTNETDAARNDFGCEVLTFGKVNHCALGGDGTAADTGSSTSTKNQVRPQRVQAFALADVGKDQSAVAVAAAAHHTLVATRNGRLYAFGFGKGGRLGTGDERHMPVPTRVLGPLARRRVVAVAAAENHSLCVTSDGRVYAFGSNRFGQLGSCATEERSGGSGSLPRRVDNLKQVFCVSVAAGDRHSVALSNMGEVYAWGDNQAGQLGIALRGGNSSGASSQQVHRVDALWEASPRRVALAISAAAHSTLVLTGPPKTGAALPLNSVFSWGHGNHVPVKVNFASSNANTASSLTNETGFMTSRGRINPVAIACAKYHNAAVSSDGRVFSWGLHAEPLGTAGRKSNRSAGSMVIATPEVVSGMLPENGGGIAVAISVCESHTAVLTDCGHLYTWGATYGKDVLGHEGVSWQPNPRRVPGVYRAVGVAAAKEHTVLLVGTSFPRQQMLHEPADLASPLSLENASARIIAKHVDLFNVVPILVIAERTNCSLLASYCHEFIRLNLDGVLTLGKRSEMDRYLNDKLADGAYTMETCPRDLIFHPLLFDLVYSKKTSYQKGTFEESNLSEFFEWLDSCVGLLDQLPLSLLSKHQKALGLGISSTALGRGRRDRSLSFNDTNASQSIDQDSNDVSHDHVIGGQDNFRGCSERCMMLTASMNLNSAKAIRSKHDCLTKEIRSVKKRLNQISRLQASQEGSGSSEILTIEQKQKIGRRPLLEADLDTLERALAQVETKMESLILDDGDVEQDRISTTSPLTEVDEEIKSDSSADAADKEKDGDSQSESADAVRKTFRCDICKISCPDANSFAIHQSGRKHRNRVGQIAQEEEKKTAASMMEMKRRQLLADDAPRRSLTTTPTAWQKKSSNSLSVQPKYKLPSPPSFPSPERKVTMSPSVVHPPPPLVLSPQKNLGGSKKVASFRSILEEEERVKLGKASHKSPKRSPRMPPTPATPNYAPATPGGGGSRGDDSTSKKSSCLGDFFGLPPTTEKTTTAPWSTPPVKQMTTTSPAAKSFLEIQQEEQAFRAKEEPTCALDGHWYIQQRERAGSISQIQQEETREREHLILVEEQKRIEAEIMREQAAKKRKEGEKKRQRGRRKGNNPKQQMKKDQNNANSTSGSNTPTPSKGGKKRTRRRKNNQAQPNTATSTAATTP